MPTASDVMQLRGPFGWNRLVRLRCFRAVMFNKLQSLSLRWMCRLGLLERTMFSCPQVLAWATLRWSFSVEGGTAAKPSLGWGFLVLEHRTALVVQWRGLALAAIAFLVNSSAQACRRWHPFCEQRVPMLGAFPQDALQVCHGLGIARSQFGGKRSTASISSAESKTSAYRP